MMAGLPAILGGVPEQRVIFSPARQLCAASRGRVVRLLCCALVVLTVASCDSLAAGATKRLNTASTRARPPSATASPAPSPSPRPDPSPTVACNGIAPGFSCVMQQRIAEVQKYLAGAPGSIGIVVEDRATGAVYRSANAYQDYPAASTMKLAMATDLLERNLAGNIHLTSNDLNLLYNALYTSNDDDANALWNEYEDGSFLSRIRAFGMSSTYFTTNVPNWGFMYCSAADLNNLINYVLRDAPSSVRDYLVYRLRHVSALDQQWGVWGAGPENAPGNKDGWEQDGTTWITNTVGFAGPSGRYTLAIMYELGGAGSSDAGFSYGTNKLTQIASLLFQGHYTAAPTPQASAVP
jgi:hypothetical protein